MVISNGLWEITLSLMPETLGVTSLLAMYSEACCVYIFTLVTGRSNPPKEHVGEQSHVTV